jgi:hypothetical protein
MARSRDEMREYQRERRARLKAEADAAGLHKVRAYPKDHPLAKAGVLIPQTAVLPTPFPPTHASTPAIGGRSAPPSMLAIGGCPGRGLVPNGPGYPLPPDQFVASPFGKWMGNVEAMLATLAAKNDAQERRIAALEKTVAIHEENRRTTKAVVATIGGLFGVRL